MKTLYLLLILPIMAYAQDSINCKPRTVYHINAGEIIIKNRIILDEIDQLNRKLDSLTSIKSCSFNCRRCRKISKTKQPCY